MLSTRDPPQNKGHIQTESEGLEKRYSHANREQKKAGAAIPISDKRDFKTKAMKRDKEGHYVMIKGSIQEVITIRNIYASKSEKAMATHSSVLAWRIPGMGEPGGLPSMGSHRVGHD